jgi:hypothetical protein
VLIVVAGPDGQVGIGVALGYAQDHRCSVTLVKGARKKGEAEPQPLPGIE